MKRYIIISVLFVCFGMFVFGFDKTQMIFPIEINGKFGFVNQDGHVVMEPVANSIERLSDRFLHTPQKFYVFTIRAGINENVKYYEGLIGFDGKIICDALKYTKIKPFENGYAAVQADKLWGFIDESGNELVSPQFDEDSDFRDGYACVVINKKHGAIDTKGSYVLQPIYEKRLRLINDTLAFEGRPYKVFDVKKKEYAEVPYIIEDYFFEDRAKIKKDGKFGFIDKQLNIVIQPIYDDASNFRSDVSFVKKDGKYGAIDSSGKGIIDATYESLSWFIEGKYFLFTKDKMQGAIDFQENIFIEPIYNDLMNNAGTLYAQKTDDYGFINSKGVFVSRRKYPNFHIGYPGFKEGYCVVNVGGIFSRDPDLAAFGGKWGVIDENGIMIIKPTYYKLYNSSNGLFRFSMSDPSNKTMYIDKKGQKVNYNAAEKDSNGDYIFITGGDGEGRGQKKGINDSKGNVVVKPIYDQVAFFSEGLAAVNIGYKSIPNQDIFEFGRYGYVNRNGETVIPHLYSTAGDFIGERAIVGKGQGWDGVIDKTGKIIIPVKYEKILRFGRYYFAALEAGLWKIFNSNGMLLLETNYKYIAEPSEGLAVVSSTCEREYDINRSSEGYFGYADVYGKVVISEKYTEALSFKNSRAVVGIKKDNKMLYGVIDRLGNYIVEPKYDTIFERDSSMFICGQRTQVQYKYSYALINHDGNVITNSPHYYKLESFSNGRALCGVPVNGDITVLKYGYLDTTGHEIITPQYEYAESFSEGYACVKLGEKYGYIDENGKVVIPMQFERANSFSEGLASVKINGSWGYIDKKGSFIIQPSFHSAGSFKNGVARVENIDYFGYIDIKGTVVIKPIFTEAEDFFHGLAKVVIDGKDAYINTKGEVVWKAK